MRFRTLGSSTIRPSELQYVLATLLATRVGLIVVGLLAMEILPLGPRRLDYLPDLPWLSIWAQWDAEHYISIAVPGYTYAPGRFTNLPFFPLYPWLIRLVAAPFGPLDERGAALAGLFITNVALFVGLIYLVALVARDLSVGAARRAVLYALVFPTTLFLSSVYAESLFLATAVATFYHARKGEWYRAGLAGGLAALTRPFGFLLLAPLAVEMLRQRPRVRTLPSLALVPAGLAVYFGFLWWQFGDPFVYFRAGQIWGRGFHWPWETLLGYLNGPLVLFDWPYSWLDLISTGAMVALVLIGWRRLPPSYSAYATVGVLFAMSTGVAWFSASRHALALFPVIVVLAVLGEWRPFRWAWPILSIVLAVAFMARVAVGYWLA